MTRLHPEGFISGTERHQKCGLLCLQCVTNNNLSLLYSIRQTSNIPFQSSLSQHLTGQRAGMQQLRVDGCFLLMWLAVAFMSASLRSSVSEPAADVRGLQRGGLPPLRLRLPEEGPRHHRHRHPPLQAARVHGGRRSGGEPAAVQSMVQ